MSKKRSSELAGYAGLLKDIKSRIGQAQTRAMPSIPQILCQDCNRVVAEYALRGMTQPIGVSEYELTRVLPRELESSLPSIEDIERELAGPAANNRPAKRRPVKKKEKRKAAKS